MSTDNGIAHLSVPPSPERTGGAHALTGVGSDLEGLSVDTVVVPGAPALVLLDAASADDLVVVGSRGRGGFTGLLLGSVSQQLVVHAPCPVVVVRVPSER